MAKKRTKVIEETQVEATPKTKKGKAKGTAKHQQEESILPSPQEQTPASSKKAKKKKSGIVAGGKHNETDLSVKDTSPSKKQKAKEVKLTKDENGIGTSNPEAQSEMKSPKKKFKKRKSAAGAGDEQKHADLSMGEVSSLKKQKTDKGDNETTDAKGDTKSPKKKRNKAVASKPTARAANNKILATNYLRLWKKSTGPGGAQWRFQKVRQVWLLNNMLDSKQISSDDFATVLEYLKGLMGNSRQLTSEKMETLIQEMDEQMQKTDEVDKDSLTEMKTKWIRASSVLQTLT